MTVSMQITKRIYAGNGVTRQWDVDFPLSSGEDLLLYVTSPAGAEEKVMEFFELNAAATQLTYPTVQSGLDPLAEGWRLTLVRQTPLTQETDLLRQGELDAEVLERGYDKLTFIVQELNEKIARSIKYPVSSNVDDLETDNFLKNILSAKQDTLDASSAAVASAAVAQQSAQNAQQLATSAAADISALSASAQDAVSSVGDVQAARLQSYVTLAQTEAETARYYAERTIGKTVGEVYWSQSALAADNPGALPLFTGETITGADDLYPDYYTWVQSHTALQCTAAEYEAALTQYGECPKYVLGTDGTLRLPLLKNYIKCATAADGITQSKAGLPNITGTTSDSGDGNNNQARVTGAFFVKATSIKSNKDDQWRGLEIGFDASRSSAVYGASDTVTPAHTTLYPWVCAYNAAVPASTAQAAAFQGALSGKVDLPSGKTQADVDYVVDSFSDEDGNWYRKYKSGWLEQGGFSHVISGTVTVSLLKPFLNTAFSTLAMIFGTPTIDIGYIRSSEKTTSTIKFNTLAANSNDTFQWAAYGQGE